LLERFYLEIQNPTIPLELANRSALGGLGYE